MFCFLIFSFVYECIYVWSMWTVASKARCVRSSGVRVTDGCRLPEEDAGNWTQSGPLYKHSMFSKPVSPLSSPKLKPVKVPGPLTCESLGVQVTFGLEQ